MHLKLEALRRTAQRVMKETRQDAALREELFRVLGPSVMVSESLSKVAAASNEQLDVMEASGRALPIGDIKTSTLLECATSKSVDVRKVVARLVPTRLSSKFINDVSSEVRCAAARRLPHAVVAEAARRHPADDSLRMIAREKRLQEAGVPTPKPSEEPFDMYGEPLDGAMKQKDPLKDMPDTWYERLAHKLHSEYGTNLEGNWEELLATRVVASHFSTTGVRLDREKLLKAIYDCIREREDAVLGEGSLRSIAERLRRESFLDEAVMPVIEEVVDPVADLLRTDFSTSQYVAAAEKLFSVKKSIVPAGIKKYRLGEGRMAETLIPVKGTLPSATVTPQIEAALDKYVESWNRTQAVAGEPYRLSWSPHPTSDDVVGFHLELK